MQQLTKNHEEAIEVGNIYGSGKGATKVILGNSTTIIEETITIANDVFGGGNAATNA